MSLLAVFASLTHVWSSAVARKSPVIWTRRVSSVTPVASIIAVSSVNSVSEAASVLAKEEGPKLWVKIDAIAVVV